MRVLWGEVKCLALGVGRYLYAALQVWVDYDPVKRAVLDTPKTVTMTGQAGATGGETSAPSA